MKKRVIPILGAAVGLAAVPLAVLAAVPPATGGGGSTGADFSAATQAIARHDDHQAANDLRHAAARLDHEVARGFDSLGRGLDDIGRAVGVQAKAQPASVG